MENQTPEKAASPGMLLAEHIVQRLIEQGFIAEQDKDLLIENLAEGRLREADWRAMFSSSLPLKES